MPRSVAEWYTVIAVSPADWDLRRVFADWLDEAGEPVLALGQRWQVKWQRNPIPPAGANYGFGWWRTTLVKDAVAFREMVCREKRCSLDDLPDAVWVRLRQTLANTCFREYPSVEAAERDLAGVIAGYNLRNECDPENPCDVWTRLPVVRDCYADGHYLCHECSRLNPNAPMLDPPAHRPAQRRHSLGLFSEVVSDCA